jgi:hypothetical protein
MQPQAAPVLAIQRMVGVHDRAGHLRAGMEQTLKGLAEQVQHSVSTAGGKAAR